MGAFVFINQITSPSPVHAEAAVDSKVSLLSSAPIMQFLSPLTSDGTLAGSTRADPATEPPLRTNLGPLLAMYASKGPFR